MASGADTPPASNSRRRRRGRPRGQRAPSPTSPQPPPASCRRASSAYVPRQCTQRTEPSIRRSSVARWSPHRFRASWPSSTPLPSLVSQASLPTPLSLPMFEGGRVETVFKTPYRHLDEPEAPTQPNVSIRLQSLLDLPFCSGALAMCAPQPLLAPLWFELPDFALEIIDAGLCIRQLTLVIFHFVAELLMPRIQLLMPRIQIF